MDAKTPTPESLRAEADRLEEEYRREQVKKLIYEFSAVTTRSSKNPDLLVRLAGIAEAARIADRVGSLGVALRGDILAWIALETEQIPEEVDR